MLNQKRNYDREMQEIVAGFDMRHPPKLLLHACCAPCSSYVIEYLSEYFLITLFFYNPNIYPSQEFEKRLEELKRLVSELKTKYPVSVMNCGYCQEDFEKLADGMELEPEGGRRCLACYELRLKKTAEAALSGEFDYFTTTLSISPMKKAQVLNDIGEKIASQYGVRYLMSDFKKRDGYKRSIELSEKYGLYRQNYCGCRFSKRDIIL